MHTTPETFRPSADPATCIHASKVKLANAVVSPWACAGQCGDAIILHAHGATADAARRNIGSALMALGDGEWRDDDINIEEVDTCDEIFAEPADPEKRFAASIVVDISL